ncbi:MAG: L-seryl-tRNA(Sec) selenium transferase [Gemmatimonadetes bacterium]|nr:L-seryl-tRNA(Sec) selenium transferase [Gemmatimonadota bacterium]
MTDVRRRLPAIGTLLELSGVRELTARAPRDLVADSVRRAVEAARRESTDTPDSDEAWVAAIAAEVERALVRSLRPVINATGVVLHTNLGRAPLAAQALAAVRDVAAGYSNLEYDVVRGARGSRHQHCARLLCELTGAADAMIVNNCAAALVLTLNTIADGREAVISRGELVEIGGSLRVPDIMARSGASLVEVGTTNRTHAADYRTAVGPNTAAIVSVHRSNFVLEGFVASVSPAELAKLAAEAGVALVHDFGSGLMADLSPWGLRGEPTARHAVRDGATLVLMSGDKLLGGPQAGIVLGSAESVGAMRANPLARALRVDKMTLAALEATLELYRDADVAVREIPVLRMLTDSVDSVRTRAEAIALAMRDGGTACTVVESDATVGGGAFPGARIPSAAVRLDGISAPDANARLHGAAVPVVGRIVESHLVLDIRTVPPLHDELLVASSVKVLAV